MMKRTGWLAIAFCAAVAACGDDDTAAAGGGGGGTAANGGSTANSGNGGGTAKAGSGGGTAKAGSGGGSSTGDMLGSIQQTLFTPSCAVSSCHDATTHQSGLELSSASMSCAQLVAVAATESGRTGPECRQGGAKSAGLKRVVAGDSANSFLYLKLAASTECVSVSGSQAGERMPMDRGMASASAIAAVKQWIDDGASCD